MDIVRSTQLEARCRQAAGQAQVDEAGVLGHRDFLHHVGKVAVVVEVDAQHRLVKTVAQVGAAVGQQVVVEIERLDGIGGVERGQRKQIDLAVRVGGAVEAQRLVQHLACYQDVLARDQLEAFVGADAAGQADRAATLQDQRIGGQPTGQQARRGSAGAKEEITTGAVFEMLASVEETIQLDRIGRIKSDAAAAVFERLASAGHRRLHDHAAQGAGQPDRVGAHITRRPDTQVARHAAVPFTERFDIDTTASAVVELGGGESQVEAAKLFGAAVDIGQHDRAGVGIRRECVDRNLQPADAGGRLQRELVSNDVGVHVDKVFADRTRRRRQPDITGRAEDRDRHHIAAGINHHRRLCNVGQEDAGGDFAHQQVALRGDMDIGHIGHIGDADGIGAAVAVGRQQQAREVDHIAAAELEAAIGDDRVLHHQFARPLRDVHVADVGGVDRQRGDERVDRHRTRRGRGIGDRAAADDQVFGSQRRRSLLQDLALRAQFDIAAVRGADIAEAHVGFAAIAGPRDRALESNQRDVVVVGAALGDDTVCGERAKGAQRDEAVARVGIDDHQVAGIRDLDIAGIAEHSRLDARDLGVEHDARFGRGAQHICTHQGLGQHRAIAVEAGQDLARWRAEVDDRF